MSERPALAVALDLGSTRLKLAALDADGGLRVLEALDAPRVREVGLQCEFDAEELHAATEVLLGRALAECGPGAALGVASQRSSFAVWNGADASLVRPQVISWRDRRALAWCERQASRAGWIEALTGLRLSPHYLGPKLAHLAGEGLFAQHAGEDLRIGTLESFLAARRRPHGERHVTDASMAARTLLFDPRRGEWSREALEWVGAPRSALADVTGTHGRALELGGGLVLRASISDQASAFLASARPGGGELLVNLGTGGFVLRESATFAPLQGYLCGPLLASKSCAPRFALEGTINAGAAVLAGLPGPTPPPSESDPTPELYCAPDVDGIGAPHWRAGLTTTYSRDAASISPSDRRRAFLEGLCFRVREIADDLDPDRRARVALAGGLSNEPFVAPALAAVLGREVERLEEGEATLLGVARLAAGLDPFANPARASVAPAGAWLREKYARWRAWRDAWLSGAR